VQSCQLAFQRILIAHGGLEFSDKPTNPPDAYGGFHSQFYLRNVLFRFEQFVIQLIHQYVSI